jgi:hypothetical protein
MAGMILYELTVNKGAQRDSIDPSARMGASLILIQAPIATILIATGAYLQRARDLND